MASETEIANLACSKLGDEDQIIDLRSGESRAARAIAAVFDTMRDTVLRAGQWNFAQTRVALPALTDKPAWGFGYAYQLPADYLALSNLQDDIDYQIEAGRILTNATPPLKLRYIRRVTDTGTFDALFIDALACRLAAQVAMRLTGERTVADGAMAAYRLALNDAKAIDGPENPPEDYAEDDWMIARESGY